MDYNELKRKYGAQNTAPAPEPQPEPVPEPIPEPAPKPVKAAPLPAKQEKPRPVKTEHKSGTSTPKPLNTGSASNDSTGLFGGGAAAPANGRQTQRRTVFPSNRRPGFRMSNLSTLPWLDIIMIALTIIGVVWVIANFDAVTIILCAGICKLLQTLMGWLLVIAVIAGLVLLISRGRRRFV